MLQNVRGRNSRYLYVKQVLLKLVAIDKELAQSEALVNHEQINEADKTS